MKVSYASTSNLGTSAGYPRPFCEAGELATETAALIAEHNIPGADDFSAAALACLPEVPQPGRGLWTVPAGERARRRDFTGVRVVSIDPPTVRQCRLTVSNLR